jgi:predicted DNA-binding ArsR family transcriptional regulator
MKKYFDFILEKHSTDDIYHLYYSDIQKDIYDEIIQADPTSKPKLMGKYGKWLLNLYKSDNLKTEDLYKATDYLELFHKYKHKLTEKDINKYSSLPDLFKVIEPYYTPDTQYLNENEHKLKGQFKEVFTGKNYRIIIPLTLNASKYFGRNTQWCTTSTDMFKHYTKNQNPNEITKDNLYILYTDNEKDKKQFHFRDQQFMDIFDNRIDLEEFYKKNPDIYDFFKKYFNPIPVNIYLSRQNISSLKNIDIPEIVEGNFDCGNNDLTTLKGAPKSVDGGFNCVNNNLTSLEYAPEKVEGDFECSNNDLTTLEYAPKSVGGSFYCRQNDLTTLKGAPKSVDGSFYCRYNKLTSLEGAPEIVKGEFDCSNNPDLTEKDIEWLRNNCDIKGEIISDFD